MRLQWFSLIFQNLSKTTLRSLEPNCDMSELLWLKSNSNTMLLLIFIWIESKYIFLLNVLIGAFASVSCVIFKQAALKIFYSEKDIMASQRLTKKRLIGFKNAKLLIIKIDHNFKDKLIFLIRSSVVCHDAFSLATSINHLVQRIEV